MSTKFESDEPRTFSITNRLHEFDPKSYDWEEWEILFDTYLQVEKVNEDSQKRNILITSLAVEPFKTLLSICKPKKPNELSYKEVIDKLRANYVRVTFTSTERIKFFASRQESPRTLTDFANELRYKATTCKFPGNFYEEALITAFVGGLQNDHVRKHLMQKNLETFEDTLNMAKTIENVLIQGSYTKSISSEDLNLNKINKHVKPSTNFPSKQMCLSCGSTDHIRPKCRFRTAVCHKCKKQGHISKVCHSKASQNQSKINTISSNSQSSITGAHPIRIPIQVENILINFELDTGSPITIVTEHIWKSMGKPNLHPVKLIYSSFSGHSISFKGETTVNVKYHDQCCSLKLVVGNGNGNNIIGRNWIHALHLHTKTLDDIVSNNTISILNSGNDNFNQLFIDYKDIFKEGLGLCKVEAHLYVKSGVTPKFCKARSLPFAYKNEVEIDLARLVSEGVIEPVDVAQWAAPIVVVPKPGGKLRICADFSTGVNQALDIDQYPLPKPNDSFVALNGGTIFSKIDFSEAYLQVPLDNDSKDLLIINTHKGLFRFNRLPFGVASAPSIFQKIMDQMLSGLDGTVCYLDDIIVTGKTKTDHLNNLKNLFERIKDYGFHINRNKCSFFKNSVEYLGFIVDRDGVRTSPSKTKAIINMPAPTNVSQLRSYLGMVNHYAKGWGRVS
jgi:hypothetical protein